MNLHQFLDTGYGPDGDKRLLERLEVGEDPNAVFQQEAPIHTAARRRRLEAVRVLIENGADIDRRNGYGKTAYAHAARRGFSEIAEYLAERNADTTLEDADKFAIAVVEGRIEDARMILEQQPGVAKTGNPEEDRLLADVSGRFEFEPVRFLIDAGADLAAPGLDDGTPLHQAAWFGQPRNARLLVDAGAPLDIFDKTHESSPIGWAVHGSRFSGGAESRQDAYVEIVELLLSAGSSLCYPKDPGGDAYLTRLRTDGSDRVRMILPKSL